jgi:hypothetical protein
MQGPWVSETTLTCAVGSGWRLCAVTGTVAYMAPECFEPRIGGVTGKADVFSFAIMLWEVGHALHWSQPVRCL